MLNNLPEILLIVSESPLAWSAFVILVITSFIIKLKLGRVERLSREIKHLPPQDRLRAIERLYDDVPSNSPQAYLKSKKQYFRFVYYLSTLGFLFSLAYISLFYANKIIPALLPFMPPPVEIVRDIPESGTVKSNLQGYVNFNRFLVDFEGCNKESTSSISCLFKIENQSGDKNFSLYRRGSRIVEKSGDELPCNLVQLSNGKPSPSFSSINLISGIPTSAIFSFDGVADDVNSIAALEAVIAAETEYLKLQYKNVPLQ